MPATKIFVVTPCLNAAETIERTLASVVFQAGGFELFYHVQDGGSDDATLDMLRDWKRRIEERQLPIFCSALHFSYASEGDEGMYDAIARGFEKFDLQPKDWMTWINADDILSPGACATIHAVDADANAKEISWVGGTAATASDDAIATHSERPLASEVIRLGLADGAHWGFVQQEGTFFRNSLWRSVDLENDFKRFRLAGDWNLWRSFAMAEALYQTTFPLGVFRHRPQQLSQQHREEYLKEIDNVVPYQDRSARLREIDGKKLFRRVIKLDVKSRAVKIEEKPLENHHKHWLEVRFSRAARQQAKPSITDAIRRDQPGIIAYDADWQFPAITEQHAYRQAKTHLPHVDGVHYLGFPWATLIDQLTNKSDDASMLVEALKRLNLDEIAGGRIITVCQHIFALKYLDFFCENGVTDIFWTHATKDQFLIERSRGVRIHPFPLYPVQLPRRPVLNGADRKYIFSFIGAKANKWYLTNVRTWILDHLAADERGLVIGREQWHYNKIVYDYQIRKLDKDATALVDEMAGQQYREALQQSVFSLCPSGSGPNSIRLWESISAGAIPVILADTYAPPGDPALWEEAAVFCPETIDDVKALPDQLEELASDKALIARKRHALTQLWMLYGPESFIYDIQKFYSEVALNPSTQVTDQSGLGLSGLYKIADSISRSDVDSESDLSFFLDACTSRILLDAQSFKAAIGTNPVLQTACARALSAYPEGNAAKRFRRVKTQEILDVTEAKCRAPVASSPDLKTCLQGRHSHRTPMAYKPYRPIFERCIEYVDAPAAADILVTGFNIDFREGASNLRTELTRNSKLKLFVVSEEPLWDTMWSGDFHKKTGVVEDAAGRFEFRMLNHTNSSIFNFEKFPYFITTEDSYFIRYGNLFRRNKELSADDLLRHWEKTDIRAAFYLERRPEERFDIRHCDDDIYGLCAYRTRVAEAASAGRVLRVGKGWSAAPRRQSLPDWHLDKLAALDRRALIVSGLENTHQANYITEKIFDAFAVLAVPLYFASPRHRVHEILPDGGFLNLFGMSEEEAAKKIDAFNPDRAFAKAYLDAQARLAALFSDLDAHIRERKRVVSEVMREIRGNL